jgi:diketogulonate reductase-like aldo/keto reductase
MEFSSIGIGTYKVKPQEQMDNLLNSALRCGYKMIDTAEIYRNQKFIGEFFRKYPEFDRTKLWITTKVSFDNVKNRNDEVIIKSINKTFIDLNTDYVDLYLIHCPIENKNVKVWNILRQYQKKGKIRHIGISNFTLDKLKVFMEEIGEEESKYIFCNQIEYNPFLNRKDLVEFCLKNNIKVVAYGCLYKNNEIIDAIATKINKTSEQVLLKWCLQNKVNIITTSDNHKYINDNICLDFEIDKDDMETMNNLNDNFCIYTKYL